MVAKGSRVTYQGGYLAGRCRAELTPMTRSQVRHRPAHPRLKSGSGGHSKAGFRRLMASVRRGAGYHRKRFLHTKVHSGVDGGRDFVSLAEANSPARRAIAEVRGRLACFRTLTKTALCRRRLVWARAGACSGLQLGASSSANWVATFPPVGGSAAN